LSRCFWPIGEAAQADYEVLREAERARWAPHADPRLDALVAGYELILRTSPDIAVAQRKQR
jgi:hypothetical protein